MLTFETTSGPFPEGHLETEAGRVIDELAKGGVALIPLDVAYAIVGMTADAIRTLFKAKRRSYEKPSGMFGNNRLSRAIHIMDDDRHDMVDTVIAEDNLPFSVVAPFRSDHPLLAAVDPFVLETSTKVGTLDMLMNAGPFHNAMAVESEKRGTPVFGSSANLSLTGSRYRLQDIDAAVRAAATLEIDHGKSRYANDQGRSSTIIDFRDFSVVRVGVCYSDLERIFKERFGIRLQITEATSR